MVAELSESIECLFMHQRHLDSAGSLSWKEMPSETGLPSATLADKQAPQHLDSRKKNDLKAIRTILRFIMTAAMLIATIGNATATQVYKAATPAFSHVVVLILENRSFNQISGNDKAPFLNRLAGCGALMTNSHGVAHPSQPNYLALFSGSTHHVMDDYKHTLDGPNLATALAHAHKSFAGFVEKNSPRKHKPWESFANARETEREMDQFRAAFSKLPAVSFVIPDNGHDMHDGSVEQADTWIEAQIAPYARWAARTNSLLVVTFDEASLLFGNHIFTLFYGAHVKPGRYPDRIDHYDVLRTLIDIARLTPFGKAAKRQPITSVWASDSKSNQRSCF
jgi:phosphatidylinositol-3-phosphatase